MEFDKAKHDRIVQIRRNLLHNIDNLARNRGAGEPTTYLDHQATLPHGYEVSAEISPENQKKPERLTAFLEQQYPGVPVALRSINAGLTYIEVALKGPDAKPGTMQNIGGKWRIRIPQLDIILENNVYLFPDRNPMTYGIKTFTTAEWVKKRGLPHKFTFEEHELDPEIVQELADMIRPHKYTPTFTGNIARHLNIVPFTEKDFQIFATIDGRPNFQTLKASDQWST